MSSNDSQSSSLSNLCVVAVSPSLMSGTKSSTEFVIGFVRGEVDLNYASRVYNLFSLTGRLVSEKDEVKMSILN